MNQFGFMLETILSLNVRSTSSPHLHIDLEERTYIHRLHRDNLIHVCVICVVDLKMISLLSCFHGGGLIGIDTGCCKQYSLIHLRAKRVVAQVSSHHIHYFNRKCP